MKRNALALLLALALALSAALPLAVGAAAADTVAVVLYQNGAAVYTKDNFSNLPSGVTASVDSGKQTVTLKLKNYTGNSIFVQTPGKKWTVYVGIAGKNTLTVNKYYGTKVYSALGTNGSMMIYAGASDADLIINGSFSGTYPDADYYALYGDEITVGGMSSYRLSVHVNFNLVTNQASSKIVYPACGHLTIGSANFYYNYESRYENAHPEEGVTLTGTAYFKVDYNAKGAKNRSARAFWGLEYDEHFVGVAYMKITNGYHYGGAYSYEKFGCETDPRFRTYIGDTEYYYVRAENCVFQQNPADTDSLGKNLRFPVTAGYVFPDRVSGYCFDASVSWEDENGNDVTGQKAEYGVKYAAHVSLVPWGTIRMPEITLGYLSFLQPALANRYSYGVDFAENSTLANGILLRYLIPVPDTVITKQPVNFDGSPSNQNARFDVEAEGPVSGYQWQMSGDGKTGWTNVTDKTSMSSTPITGAKTKSLRYNFASEPSVTLRYFRCAITGKKNGADTTLYTDVVKYENANRISVVKVNTDALPVHKQPTPTTATVSTPHVSVTGYSCKMFGKLLDSFDAGDNAQISLRLEAKDGYVFAEDVTALLEGAKLINTTLSADKKTVYLDFEYRVAVPEGGLPYETVKYYVTAPVTGETPATAVYRSDPDYVPTGGIKDRYRQIAPPVVSSEWYPAHSVFEGHREYNIVINVKTDDYQNAEYTGNPRCFDKNTVAYVNGEKAAITVGSGGKTAQIVYRFPLTADEVEISAFEFTKLDFPDGSAALDPAADCSDANVTVDGVAYLKNNVPVTKAAPGDTLRVTFSFTLAENCRLASGATAVWNGLECIAAYTGGTVKFLSTGPRSYQCAFDYTIPSVKTYAVTATGGKPSMANAPEGAIVTVTADAAPAGKAFDKWVVESGGITVVDLSAATISFVMPASDVKLKATYKDLTYTITATNGKATPEKAKKGETVKVVADAAPAGKTFDKWAVESGSVGSADLTKATLSFTMPASDVKLKATYKDLTYTITATNGKATPEKAKKGETVKVVADAAPAGKTFDKWAVESGSVGSADLTKATLSFTMPASDVKLKATYKSKPAAETVMLGDVDLNGKIESADARLALRASVGLEGYAPGSKPYIAANVDKDGKISSADARLILRASVGLEDASKW